MHKNHVNASILRHCDYSYSIVLEKIPETVMFVERIIVQQQLNYSLFRGPTFTLLSFYYGFSYMTQRVGKR